MLEIDSRRFGDTVALDGLEFSVAEGQMFGFVGPNGSGKTTTMRIVLAVLEAGAGEVRWRGKPLDPESRRRIGYMPEKRCGTFLTLNHRAVTWCYTPVARLAETAPERDCEAHTCWNYGG